MTATRAGWLTLLLITLVAAGCQQISSPPPNFDAPVIVNKAQLPTAPSGPTPQPSGRPITPNQPPVGLADVVKIDPRVKARQWRYIIVHHSDTPTGNAAKFDAAHRARGWTMLGYDFVIGNGMLSGDGQIERGPRWFYQLDGAHTGTPDHVYNDWGIGICLVGTLDTNRPTRAQMESLAKLCAYFMKTYNIPSSRILGHRDCKHTECPGRHMYGALPQLRQMASAYAKGR